VVFSKVVSESHSSAQPLLSPQRLAESR